MDLRHAFFAVVAIAFYTNYRCSMKWKRDILSTKLGVWNLDLWSVSHVILFYYLAKENRGQKNAERLFFLGVAWELFEHTVAKNPPSWAKGCDVADGKDSKEWWYGRTSDLLSNLLGILIANNFFQK